MREAVEVTESGVGRRKWPEVDHNHANHRDRACRVYAAEPSARPVRDHELSLGDAGRRRAAYRAAAHRSSIHTAKRNMKVSKTISQKSLRSSGPPDEECGRLYKRLAFI